MQKPFGCSGRGLAALMGAVLAWNTAAAQPEPPAPRAGPDRIVMLCKTADGAPGAWRDTIISATIRAFATERTTRTQIRGDVNCPPAETEYFCRAGVLDRFGPTAICDPRVLVRLARAAAWYAAQRNAGETYDRFRSSRGERLSLQALGFADGGESGRGAADLRLFTGEVLPSSDADRSRRETFRAILDLTLAAVFGHEAAHMETQKPFCPVAEPSRTEAEILPVAKRVQLTDELFTGRELVQGESTADRCATRRIRLVRSVLAGAPAPDGAALEFASRAAADLVATGLAFGFRPTKDGRLRFQDTPGYYYPALRITLLAGEIGADMPGAPLCGAAAEIAVQAYQLGLQTASGRGQLPDQLEEQFPEGVIDAWNGSAWSPEAFKCGQPRARAGAGR